MNISIEASVLLISTLELNIDHAYQRSVSKSLVRKIKENFCVECFDFPLVGKRKDGTYWVVDGQTRVTAAKELDIDAIPCRTFDSGGKKHEASMFRMINEIRRSMKRLDIYKAALAAGDEVTVEIERIVKSYGFKVGYTNSWPCIRAVAKLYDAYADGVLNEVLLSITNAWHENSNALLETSVGGLWQFFKRSGPDIDMKRCFKKWSRRNPTAFIQTADQAKASGGSRYLAFANGLLAEYNKGLSRNKLEW